MRERYGQSTIFSVYFNIILDQIPQIKKKIKKMIHIQFQPSELCIIMIYGKILENIENFKDC